MTETPQEQIKRQIDHPDEEFVGGLPEVRRQRVRDRGTSVGRRAGDHPRRLRRTDR